MEISICECDFRNGESLETVCVHLIDELIPLITRWSLTAEPVMHSDEDEEKEP